jgi:hypothetical protein
MIICVCSCACVVDVYDRFPYAGIEKFFVCEFAGLFLGSLG